MASASLAGLEALFYSHLEYLYLGSHIHFFLFHKSFLFFSSTRGFRAHFRVQSNEVISRISFGRKELGVNGLRGRAGRTDFREGGGRGMRVVEFLVECQTVMPLMDGKPRAEISA